MVLMVLGRAFLNLMVGLGCLRCFCFLCRIFVALVVLGRTFFGFDDRALFFCDVVVVFVQDVCDSGDIGQDSFDVDGWAGIFIVFSLPCRIFVILMILGRIFLMLMVWARIFAMCVFSCRIFMILVILGRILLIVMAGLRFL